jgi:hypothetical protein
MGCALFTWIYLKSDSGNKVSVLRDTYQCQCYQVGGPFIAEDPDCPIHGANGMEIEYVDEITRLRAALSIFANPNNWRANEICDPNGGSFIGIHLAQNALNRG